MTAKLFPMVMMMGLMILIAALVIGIVNAALAYDYWNLRRRPAQSGSRGQRVAG